MKDIPEFEGKYAITSCGKVWSYKHKKFLKPKCVRGYARVDLVDKDNKVHQLNVHRLVALTYISNPSHLPFVNHKDENKLNNCLRNLEWCSCQYNNVYGTRLKRVWENMSDTGRQNIRESLVKARSKAVRCIETGTVYCSAAEAQRQTGISHSHIGSVCRGARRRCGGYHWEYYNE